MSLDLEGIREASVPSKRGRAVPPGCRRDRPGSRPDLDLGLRSLCRGLAVMLQDVVDRCQRDEPSQRGVWSTLIVEVDVAR